MKKMTKKSLEELARIMPVLSEFEQTQFMGGDTYYMDQFGRITGKKETGGPDVIHTADSAGYDPDS